MDSNLPIPPILLDKKQPKLVDVEKRREYMRKYNEEHREKLREDNRKLAQKKKETRLQCREYINKALGDFHEYLLNKFGAEDEQSNNFLNYISYLNNAPKI